MADDIIEIDTSELEKSIMALEVVMPSRDLPKFMDLNMKGMVVDLVRWTPPGSASGEGIKARQMGEARLTSDILKVLFPVSKKSADIVGLGALADAHNRRRNKRTGRVHGRHGRATVLVGKTDLRRYIAQEKRQVGTVASGWKPAASKFQAVLPAWISRHNGAGSANKEVTADKITLWAQNAVSYAGNLGMQKRAELVGRTQNNKLQRRLEHLLAQKIRQAGFGAA